MAVRHHHCLLAVEIHAGGVDPGDLLHRFVIAAAQAAQSMPETLRLIVCALATSCPRHAVRW